MQESINIISQFGKSYSPISDYNKLIGNNLGNVNVDQANQSFNQFQNILNEEISNVQAAQTNTFNMGISVENVFRQNFDDLFMDPNAKPSKLSPVETSAKSFSKAFNDNITSLNQKQLESEYAVETLASGGDISVHEVMIASEKAGLSMQMAMQLRNRLMSAYNELYQMRF